MITKRGNRYLMTRFCAGLGHHKQKHRSAPTNRGSWCFFQGHSTLEIAYFCLYRDKGDKNCPKDPDKWDAWYKKQNHCKWHDFWLPSDASCYVGWTKRGMPTRDGFFNAGDWQAMTIGEAAESMTKMLFGDGKLMPYIYDGVTYHQLLKPDNCNLQIYIPHTVKMS